MSALVVPHRATRSAVVLCAALALSGCGGSAATALPSEVESSSETSEESAEESAAASPGTTLVSHVEPAERAPDGAITVQMTADLTFEPSEATAEAGTVVFFLENVSSFPEPLHNMWVGTSIEEPLAHTPDLREGESVIFTIEGMTAGSYLYWCTIFRPLEGDQHFQAGMVGTLTITP